MLKWIPLFACVVFWSCADEKPAASGCRDNSGCGAGEICVDGSCRGVCVVDADCGEGEICVDDVCATGVRTPPIIEKLDGDGSADAGASDPRGTRADRHVRRNIQIVGQNLEASVVTLQPDGGAPVELVLVSVSAKEIVAALPADVAAGRHLLTVTNQSGADQVDVWLLQGEKGDQGDPGDPATADGVLLLLQSLGDPVPGLNAATAAHAATATSADSATTAANADAASAVLDENGVARDFEDLAVPIGTILPFAGDPATLPGDWIVCDGSTVASPHAALIDFDSGTPGVQVPDLVDNRFLMGVNAGGLGTAGGTNTIATDGSHTHTFNQSTTIDAAPDASEFSSGSFTDPAGGHDHGGDNRPRYLGVLFVIRIN